MEESREQDTDVEDLHTVDAHQECHQHEDHGQTQLQSEHCVLLLAQLATRRKKRQC